MRRPFLLASVPHSHGLDRCWHLCRGFWQAAGEAGEEGVAEVAGTGVLTLHFCMLQSDLMILAGSKPLSAGCCRQIVETQVASSLPEEH